MMKREVASNMACGSSSMPASWAGWACVDATGFSCVVAGGVGLAVVLVVEERVIRLVGGAGGLFNVLVAMVGNFGWLFCSLLVVF